MKKIILICMLVLVLILVFGCEQQIKTETQPESELKEPESKAQEIVSKGIFTDTYIYKDEDVEGKVVVSKRQKTADVELKMYIADEDEFEFTITMACGFILMAFTNESAIDEMIEEGILQKSEEDETEEEPDILKGVEIKSLKLSFMDKEDKSKIADCIAKTKNPDDINFVWYNTTTEEELEKQQEALWGHIEEGLGGLE